jgi:hypothetical protein
MKTLLILFLLIGGTSTALIAQALPPASVHFLNIGYGQFFEIKTRANQKEGIILKPKTWTLIQPEGDSLGLVFKDNGIFIHVEPGKQYYFVIQTDYGSRPVVTEKAEREFLLTAGINAIKKPPMLLTSPTTE